MSRAAAASVFGPVSALLLSCTGAMGGAGAYREPIVVQFSYEAVQPETVRIPADGNLTWLNAAPETQAFVVFPASIASSFRCDDLRPYFTKAADVYRSLPLTGSETERVQLPCALAPGTYDYEIWLVGAGLAAEFDGSGPQRVLRAKIVVE